MKNLTKILASLAIAGSLAGTSKAGDYIKEERWGLLGAGHTITYTHTEPGFVLVPQRFVYRDICGRCYEGVNWLKMPAEVVTSQWRESHIHWDQSIIALPGNILTAVGEAITPKPRLEPIYVVPSTTLVPLTPLTPIQPKTEYICPPPMVPVVPSK